MLTDEIAKKLTPGAKRACIAMTGEWQFSGKATFAANGAWALHWARHVKGGRGLICQREVQKDGRYNRDAYRLTLLGLALKVYLEASK